MTDKFIGSHTKTLTTAGLTVDQATMYELLIKRGGATAGKIHRNLSYSRPQVYKVLEELVAYGLVSRENVAGKPTHFNPNHPFAVEELVRKKQEEWDIAKHTVQGLIGTLVSEYTAASRVPGVRILPGMNGLKEMYADILREKKDICLIRSTFDDDTEERKNLVRTQIKQQVALAIHARVIGPLPKISVEEIEKNDRERLTTRKVFKRESFILPAQIVIYGEKVALTAYDDPLMTTIIENDAIQKTLSVLFEVLWQTAHEPRELLAQ